MKLEYIITKDEVNMRLDDFFYMKGISKKLVKDAKFKGSITVNGVWEKVPYRTKENDHVVIVFSPEESHVVPVDIPINIIYEDEYLMVIDKQKDLASIPNRKYYTESLANGIMYYFKKNHIVSSVHMVNRLDKETSGLLLVAKSSYIHDVFSKDIKKVQRVYHALVEGDPGEGIVDASIGHDDDHATKRRIDGSGLSAITHYKTIKRMMDQSIVECILETGRTHQIRVHMAYIRHPLVGDPLYGHEGTFYLDSVKISFEHPITGKTLTFTKEDPYL